MLFNQRRLKAEIAQRAADLAQERQELIAQVGSLRNTAHRRATSPLALGILFLAGLGVGLLSGRRWLPKSLSYVIWRGGAPFITGLLTQWASQLMPHHAYDDDADAAG